MEQKKKSWGRPKGSKMSEEAKRKISVGVKAAYKARVLGMSPDQEAKAQEEFSN